MLLIVEKISEREARILSDSKRSTHISGSIKDRGTIEVSGEESLFKSLEDIRSHLSQHGVERVVAVATQVFRAAENGPQIVNKIRKRFGWDLQIISGKEEARLSYLAAPTEIEGISESRIVADVGGGSTEIIIGRGKRAEFICSYPIGAVNLTEKFNLDSAVTIPRITETDDYLAQQFDGQEKHLPEPRGDFVVVGGTAVALGGAFHDLTEFDPSKIHGTALKSAWIDQVANRLAGYSLEQRKEFIPFDPERAGIIFAGTLIVRWLLNWSRRSSLVVSDRGLRWGLLLSRFEEIQNTAIKHRRPEGV